jgi:hypothetical protein
MEYEIHVLAGNVTYESLTDVTRGLRKTVFRREPGKACEIGEIASDACRPDELIYARKMGETLPGSEVFLTTIKKLQVPVLLDFARLCYEWFAETLCIIGTDGYRVGLGLDLLTQLSNYSAALADADTGVEKIQFHELDANIDEVVPPRLLADFKSSEDDVRTLPGDPSTMLVKDGNGVKVMVCDSVYTASDGSPIIIPLAKESDGTRRYLNLLPILFDGEKDRVYLVDELDRSLHTSLSKSLIRTFRKIVESKKRKLQLIFTTHDVMLMDGDNFRKDEIWVTERDEVHQAHLIAMAEFKDIRPDLQLRKSYLEGRMGGLPHLFKAPL